MNKDKKEIKRIEKPLKKRNKLIEIKTELLSENYDKVYYYVKHTTDEYGIYTIEIYEEEEGDIDIIRLLHTQDAVIHSLSGELIKEIYEKILEIRIGKEKPIMTFTQEGVKDLIKKVLERLRKETS